MRRPWIAVVAVVLMSTLVLGQTTTINLNYTWTAPVDGSPVHHYVVQSSSNGTTWVNLPMQPTTAATTVPAPVGIQIQIRVAGVDAQGRQGVWSEAADPFVPDAGAPGAPSKPVRVP